MLNNVFKYIDNIKEILYNTFEVNLHGIYRYF